MKFEINSILADVDPRRDQQPTLARAEMLARKSGAAVRLYACDYLYSFAGGVFFDDEEEEEARKAYMVNVERRLDELAAALDQSIDVTTAAEWKSSRVDGLLAQAEAVDADIIIRAATEHSKVDRLLIGATDWELIRRAPQHLWLAKGDMPKPDDMTVLAAIDPTHSADSEAGLDRRLLATATGFARLFKGRVYALHCYMPVPPAPVFAPGAAMGTAAPPMSTLDENQLDKLRERLLARIGELTDDFDVPRDNVHVQIGPTTATIDEFINENDVDVVVAGAVSRSWLERLIVGSTAERLLDTVDCDVMVVKPEGFAAGRH